MSNKPLTEKLLLIYRACALSQKFAYETLLRRRLTQLQNASSQMYLESAPQRKTFNDLAHARPISDIALNSPKAKYFYRIISETPYLRYCSKEPRSDKLVLIYLACALSQN